MPPSRFGIISSIRQSDNVCLPPIGTSAEARSGKSSFLSHAGRVRKRKPEFPQSLICRRHSYGLRWLAIPTAVGINRQGRRCGSNRNGRRRLYIEHGRSPNLTPAIANWGALPLGRLAWEFGTIVCGVKAKGLFPRKFAVSLQCPSTMARSPVPIHVPSANHTSSYGLIYAQCRLRLDRLCRNGGLSDFFP